MERDVYQVRRITLVCSFAFCAPCTALRTPSNVLSIVLCILQGDVGSGFTFSIPTVYDGLKFGGVPAYVDCASNLDVSSNSCASLSVCVREGTTWADIIAEYFPEENYILTDGFGFDMLANGMCNVVAGETPIVLEDNAIAAGYTGDYAISTNTLSKEPLAWVSRQEDERFSDIINWVIMALLTAEEQGITQATATDFPTYDGLGETWETIFRDAVAAVGNYGEIYDRTLESVLPRSGLNEINEGGSGLIYSIPFGSLGSEGPLSASDTIAEILDDGMLKCGVVRTAGQDDFYHDTGMWSGFDVDFCRALSAALFFGDPTRVVFYDLPSPIRFIALESGFVDVLSRKSTVTLSRDIKEPTSDAGFAATSPNFYDGAAFGGVPVYVVQKALCY